jgi:outer membrane protein W
LIHPASFAQQFSVQTSVGVVHLPFYDWSKFWGELPNSFYSKNNPNLYYSLYVHYSLNSDNAINIGTELINSSAFLSSSTVTIDWKFRAIPITLGYEYKILTFNKGSALILGAGFSYFISKVTAHDNYFNITSNRYGNGYGVQGSVGLNAELTENIGMVSQVRYRYSDGMAFTDKKGSIKIEFTGFDFSTGLSYNF